MSWRCAVLLAAAATAACTFSEEVGSVWVESATVTPESGGTITVTAADSASLAGAVLSLPPQALATATLIGAAPGAVLASGDLAAASASIEWDPADAGLLLPASFTLPAQLPQGRDPDDFLVLAEGPAGLEVLSGPQLQFDPGSGSLRFSATHLGTFQAAVGKACHDRDDCAAGEECDDGECKPESSPPDGGPPHRR